MKCINVAILLLLVFVTAISQVRVRHQHRIHYVELNTAIGERDDLNIEWNQLLTESSTWSFPHRVEKDATKELSMRAPKAKDVLLIDELGNMPISAPIEKELQAISQNGITSHLQSGEL